MNNSSLIDNYIWMLDLVVEFRIPICVLCDENYESLFNRKWHGLSPSEVSQMLSKCHEINLISFFKNSKEESEISQLKILQSLVPLPINERLESMYYGLSELDGQEWGKISNARWDMFISIWSGYHDDNSSIDITIESQEKKKAEKILDKIASIPSVIINHEFTHAKTLLPWHPVYWKTLDSGFRIELNVENSDIVSHCDFPESPKWYSYRDRNEGRSAP